VARIRAGGEIDGEVSRLWSADQTRQRLADSMESLRRR
jgi:enoyl-CoA hydratase